MEFFGNALFKKKKKKTRWYGRHWWGGGAIYWGITYQILIQNNSNSYSRSSLQMTPLVNIHGCEGKSEAGGKDFKETTARKRRKKKKRQKAHHRLSFEKVVINPGNNLFHFTTAHPQTFFPVDFSIWGFVGLPQSLCVCVCVCVCVCFSIITLVQLKIKWGQSQQSHCTAGEAGIRACD